MTTVLSAPGTTPNDVLRAVRIGLRMSQDDLAKALRLSGEEAGDRNDASKRLVQRWESGISRSPRPVYARALERVTGRPVEALGFSLPVPVARVHEDGAGGHDTSPDLQGVAAAHNAGTAAQAAPGSLTGVWLSRYEFFSSGREQVFESKHHVLVVERGERLTVESLPSASTFTGSSLSLDLARTGNVVTGSWREQTGTDGYYRGAVYHGALQMLVELTGRRMAGKWVGFGKDFDVNTGPWELRFLVAGTSKAALEQYAVPPE